VSLQGKQVYEPDIKFFDINGKMVKVTHRVDSFFYGRYEGAKGGYLLLNKDGSGEYLYDIMIPSINCEPGVIPFNWGFILDENNRIVHFERDYGFSYPVIFFCTEEKCFQGCRINFMIDYILEKGNGVLEVSSSDDWVKMKLYKH
jgi:hypothetical protein